MTPKAFAVACVAGLLATCLSGPSASAQEMPTVEINPPSGPLGTFVEFSGSGFTDPSWSDEGVRVWFIREISDDCELVLNLHNARFELSDDGTLSGSGNVGTVGACKQSDGSPQPVPTGTYTVSYGCYACTVGEFTVTEPTTTTTATGLPYTGSRENQLTGMAAIGVALVLLGATLLLLARTDSAPHNRLGGMILSSVARPGQAVDHQSS